MAKKLAAAVGAAQLVSAYKGFNRDLTCTPSGVKFQYEVGKSYNNGGKNVTRCGEGAFHGVAMPLDAFSYYGPATSVYHDVGLGGDIVRKDDEDTKIASAEITINAEVKLPEFIRAAVKWVIGEAKERVTTGYRAHAASTGSGAHAASTGYRAHAASTGSGAHAASTGDYAHAASTGYRAHAASTGDYAHAASTGDYAHAASTGSGAHAASTGDYAHAASTGSGALAVSLGVGGTAKSSTGIVLAAYDESVWPPRLIAVRSSLVGENGIEAGKAYRLTQAGEFEEVK
ncbi:hypothetical protein [Mesorhizobium sp.]|uniref:DUF7666 domain-containing protein n=1 Tax=Mesorhizobium sp. TaxID=1871066 RepID=UPI000FE9F6B8|nr:hypothetical protein [Mesorhizobium sp.]RWO20705.1 MAG: hypothetical protein EOS09_26675 [Mesorhizobium sp.]